MEESSLQTMEIGPGMAGAIFAGAYIISFSSLGTGDAEDRDYYPDHRREQRTRA